MMEANDQYIADTQEPIRELAEKIDMDPNVRLADWERMYRDVITQINEARFRTPDHVASMNRGIAQCWKQIALWKMEKEWPSG